MGDSSVASLEIEPLSSSWWWWRVDPTQALRGLGCLELAPKSLREEFLEASGKCSICPDWWKWLSHRVRSVSCTWGVLSLFPMLCNCANSTRANRCLKYSAGIGSSRKLFCLIFMFARAVVDSAFLGLIGCLWFPEFKWMENCTQYRREKNTTVVAGTH